MDGDTILFLARGAAAAYDPPAREGVFKNGSGEIRGFLDFAHGAVCVCIKGTKSFRDWLKDGNAILTDIGGARVHLGFLLEYRQIIDKIRRYVNAHQGYPIWCTGHSLGGALATLVAVAMKGEQAHREVKLLTLGSPRVGDHSFARHAEAMGIEHLRIVHAYDIVPRVPKLGYWHVGDPLRLNDKGRAMPAVHGCLSELASLLHVLQSDADGEAFNDHHVDRYVAAVEKYTERKGGAQ